MQQKETGDGLLSGGGKTTWISRENLGYYFDGVERQRLDAGALSRKSGACLALRHRLVRLPDETFEVVLNSIHALIDSLDGNGASAATDPALDPASAAEAEEAKLNSARGERQQLAQALFEKVADAERRRPAVASAGGDQAVPRIS